MRRNTISLKRKSVNRLSQWWSAAECKTTARGPLVDYP